MLLKWCLAIVGFAYASWASAAVVDSFACKISLRDESSRQLLSQTAVRLNGVRQVVSSTADSVVTAAVLSASSDYLRPDMKPAGIAFCYTHRIRLNQGKPVSAVQTQRTMIGPGAKDDEQQAMASDCVKRASEDKSETNGKDVTLDHGIPSFDTSAPIGIEYSGHGPDMLAVGFNCSYLGTAN